MLTSPASIEHEQVDQRDWERLEWERDTGASSVQVSSVERTIDNLDCVVGRVPSGMGSLRDVVGVKGKGKGKAKTPTPVESDEDDEEEVSGDEGGA